MDDRPLSEAIAHAYFVARRTCDGTPARSAAGGPEAVLQALAGIYKRGQVAGVFSSNEEGEEMSAAGAWCLQSLKWQADVADTITPRTPATLNRALTLYTEFCSLCFEIGVLPRAIAAWAGVAGEDEPVPAAMSAREGKIARYRASQALESNCAECQRVACSGELDEDALAGSIRADDGDDRAWALASLQLAALQGAEALVAAKEEMPLLARMARSMPADRGEQVAQLHRTCARVRGESMSPRHSHAGERTYVYVCMCVCVHVLDVCRPQKSWLLLMLGQPELTGRAWYVSAAQRALPGALRMCTRCALSNVHRMSRMCSPLA